MSAASRKRIIALICLILCAIVFVACLYWVINRRPVNVAVEPRDTVSVADSSIRYGQVFVAASNPDPINGVRVNKGERVTLSADGKANGSSNPRDMAYKEVGPDGWGSDPSFNANRLGPCRGGESYMALAYRLSTSKPSMTDGGWTFAGKTAYFIAPQDEVIWFTTCDKTADAGLVWHPEWRADNQGGFMVQVKIQK